MCALMQAFHAINEDMARAKEEKVKRDRELAKVTIRKEEVELIVSEPRCFFTSV